MESKIFTGFRALGYISTDAPLAVRYHKKHRENYIVTAVGRAFHVYNCSRLGIVSVSDIHPDKISIVSTSQRHIFTACGSSIRCFDKGRKAIHTYEGHTNDITFLLPFGRHLISGDCSGKVNVYDVHSEGIYLTMHFAPQEFEITAAAHPCTYINKVLFGSRQGQLQLWNILKDQLVFTFAGWGEQVTAIEQAPAVDVLAVGLADGRILLHNFKYDETVMKFTQDWGPVTAISFRTDGTPTMIAASASGHMAFWDLEKKSLLSQTLQAHGKAVSGLQCLTKEPILVTSSADNSLKVWIFDQPDGGVRLLRMREGHSAPPNFLRHYGTDGGSILSAGQDSTVRMYSTVHDKHNISLGRASFNKAETKRVGLKDDMHKMPPITHFATESNRDSDFDSVVACHRGLRMVTTWSPARKTMGKFKLDCKRFHHGNQHRVTTAEAVDISSCGNYAVIGYSSGHVDLFNMQSGRHRGSFGKHVAHPNGVRGVAFEANNSMLITAGDKDIKFWRFGDRDRGRVILKELTMSDNIIRIFMHRDSHMLAVVHENFTVTVIDIGTLKTARVFEGHTNAITDLTFSGDARWLITASMDCTVRTWSMVHGRLIDCFCVESAVTTLSMSPTGDFLATGHVGDVGVYLWANKTLYSHVPLQPLPENFQPKTVCLPHTTSTIPAGVDAEDEDVVQYEEAEFKSPDQISDELVTLSLLPKSRWLNLLHFEIIKMRNKPKEPPKLPKSAPFFLPTIPGLTEQFDLSSAKDQQEESSSRIVKSDFFMSSEFAQLLLKAEYKVVLNRLKNQGSHAIDSDIRSLNTTEELLAFLQFVHTQLQSHRDFDVINGYLGLFLQVHREEVPANKELVDKMKEIDVCIKEASEKLDEDMRQSLCIQKFMVSSKVV